MNDREVVYQYDLISLAMILMSDKSWVLSINQPMNIYFIDIVNTWVNVNIWLSQGSYNIHIWPTYFNGQ